MEILVNVSNQKLKIATNLRSFVEGSQEFVRFTFNLGEDWNNLLTFAQFGQNGTAYNQYLDENNSVYLPSEIVAGTCTLMLYGSGGNTRATTNFLTLVIDENILVADAESTEISQSLYDQLVDMIQNIDETVIGQSASDWLAEHITVPTNPIIDSSLLIHGAAADSKTVGDRFNEFIEVGETPSGTGVHILVDGGTEEITLATPDDLDELNDNIQDKLDVVVSFEESAGEDTHIVVSNEAETITLATGDDIDTITTKLDAVKNLSDELVLTQSDFQNGYYQYGQILQSNKRLCTKRMYSVVAGDSLYIDNGGLEIGVWIYENGDTSVSAVNELAYTTSPNNPIELQTTGLMLIQLKDGTNDLSPSSFDGEIKLVSRIVSDVKKIGSTVEEDFTYFDKIENTDRNLIDYGYSRMPEIASKVVGTTNGRSIGITRKGVFITLDGTATGSSVPRIRVSGTIDRVATEAAVKAWPGSTCFENGKTYRIFLECLSNFVSGISVSAYQTGESSSLGTYERDGTTFIRTFTAGETPITIALYIQAGTVIDNATFKLTIQEIDPYENLQIESYFLEEMEDAVKKVRESITEPSIVFPVVTDIHRFSSSATKETFDNMIRNIKYFADRVKCDFLLNLGDVTDGDKTQSVTMGYALDCTEQFKNIGLPYYFVNGNHDTNYASASGAYLFTKDENYQAWFAANGYNVSNLNTNGTDYYVDFTDVGIRMICVDSNNVQVSGRKEYTFAPETIPWLIDALKTEYKVLFCTHMSPYTNQVYNNQALLNASGVRDALQDFIDDGGNIVMLSGHSHRDMAFVNPFLSIAFVNQRFTEHEYGTDPMSVTDYIDVVANPARVSNTYTEDAWTVCVYNTIDNILNCIRFGAGCDRIYHTLETSQLSFASKLSGELTWSSSDTSIATVSNGTVTKVSDGRCAIIAKDSAGNYECWILNTEEDGIDNRPILGNASLSNLQTALTSEATARQNADATLATSLAEEAETRATQFDDATAWALGAYATSSASGAVATVDDGAEGVPVKALTAYIVPVQDGSGDPSSDNVRQIHGFTGMSIARTGKNLCNPSLLGDQATWNTFAIKVKPNTIYVMSSNKPTNDGLYLFFKNNDTGGGSVIDAVNADHPRASTSSADGYVYVSQRKASGDTSFADYWYQIEEGNTPTPYEPYSEQTYPVTWSDEAGTVYGGYFDAVTGVLTVTHAGVDMGSLNWTFNSSASWNCFSTTDLLLKKPGVFNLMCERYAVKTVFNTSDDNIIAGNASNRTVTIRDMSYNGDTATFKQAVTGQTLVYELATPIEYQLSPLDIRTLRGVNNIFADTGDTDATVRADPDLHINKLIAEAVALALENA